MTTATRKILEDFQIELPIRVNKNNSGNLYVFRGDEFIDTLEIAIIKSPEFKQELKDLLLKILQ